MCLVVLEESYIAACVLRIGAVPFIGFLYTIKKRRSIRGVGSQRVRIWGGACSG